MATQPAPSRGFTVGGYDVVGIAEFVGFVVADILAFVKHLPLPFELGFLGLALHGLHHGVMHH